MLDPSSDGMQQIAAILAANDLTDLSSISIVGHGSSGAIEVRYREVAEVVLITPG